ncbi:hypothetical protein GCM10010238_22120 [Streptomyces griseoviridis]|uniref:Uncharacterized protein n=1 Tax=Streptomyces griseoviridis TaxID=45398 RepID=A0A918GFD0_STRGD|nr:hypothetical protein GCM10010238_22120 [Streptomyces niveoruber]
MPGNEGRRAGARSAVSAGRSVSWSRAALAFDTVPPGSRLPAPVGHLVRLVRLVTERGEHLDLGFLPVPYGTVRAVSFDPYALNPYALNPDAFDPYAFGCVDDFLHHPRIPVRHPRGRPCHRPRPRRPRPARPPAGAAARRATAQASLTVVTRTRRSRGPLKPVPWLRPAAPPGGRPGSAPRMRPGPRPRPRPRLRPRRRR